MASVKVDNLSSNVTEAMLTQLFRDKGINVSSMNLPKDPDTGLCRGYAIVEVDTIDVRDVISPLDQLEFEGKVIHVKDNAPISRGSSSSSNRGSSTGRRR
jgi:RNA recognition motif-containing protein